jgi:hypothetical protein
MYRITRLYLNYCRLQMCDILCQKGLMLWEAGSRQYLAAHEREKQLLFFLLAFVAQDKAARLPQLKSLLQCLRLALLGMGQLDTGAKPCELC